MRWLRPEDRAEISPTCSATYLENTPLLLIGSQSQVSKRVLTMLNLVLNLLTRIKLGHHTWCAKHALRHCVGGPIARRVWTLEFQWFEGSQPTMSLTANFALLMWLGSTERTGAASSILIFNQHLVLLLIVIKFQGLSSENFLTLVTKMPPVLKDMKTKKKWFLKIMLYIHFPKMSWII